MGSAGLRLQLGERKKNNKKLGEGGMRIKNLQVGKSNYLMLNHLETM